ncbi:TPA: GIY-YIG nuclease family protein, partial [Enterococcus faecium]
ELNTRAGYVYVISNIGSFGEDIYKIGMTRRLEPMDRIKELSSASVPFEFDVHAMIFSEDAPSLETKLHNHFRKQEVNKINQRKEFFKVSLDEIEKVVLENYNGTVTFTKLAKAEQYRRSLELSKD